VKLREYMQGHAGEYTLAETALPATIDDIDPDWLDREVDVYFVGIEGGGRHKYHVFLKQGPHLLTHVMEQAGDEGQESSLT